MAIDQGLRRKLIEIVGNGWAGDLVVAWAVDALTAGFDSPSLRILAGLSDPDPKDVRHFLQLTCDELDFTLPGPEECLRLYARSIAEDILAGRIAPAEGCVTLNKLGGDYCDAWTGLESALEHAAEGWYSTIEEVERQIRERAAEMLTRDAAGRVT